MKKFNIGDRIVGSVAEYVVVGSIVSLHSRDAVIEIDPDDIDSIDRADLIAAGAMTADAPNRVRVALRDAVAESSI